MPSRFLPILSVLAFSLPLPAVAETTVIHAIEGRFGVSYASDATGRQSGLQPLYEGRYTTSFLHQSDNGLQFRFDIGIIVGNMDPDRPGHGSRSADRTVRF